MSEEPFYGDRPGAHFRRHLAKWRDHQESIRERVPQHDSCEAIGSVLNGSRKPRWHTRRAGAVMVLASLTGFSAAVAVGAVSLLATVVALGFGTATVTAYRVEHKRRYERGMVSTPPRQLIPGRSGASRLSLRMVMPRRRGPETRWLPKGDEMSS